MVTREQWKIAQEKEIQHHANNFDFNEANKNHYREIYQNIFNFVNPEFNFDVKNKKILEIGPGVFAAFLYCNNTENSIIIEPLNFPENVKKVYENKNIKILNEAVEDIEIPKVDEIWVFNVMQHIYNPGQFVAKLKKSARKILFFEPINTAIDDLHLHSYSFEDFQNYFGKNVVKQYDGGSIKNFHTANCAYGVWESNNIDNIGVIGIGKLGICLSLVLEKAGYNVLGVDINQNYVDLINNKEFKTSEPFVNEYLKTNTNFIATLDLEKAINDSSVVFVVVATPSLKAGQYDHTQVDSLIEKIKKLGKQKESKHLVITCTVMPGYCDKIQNQLEEYNWKVSYNPEFIALGTVIQNQENPDALLIGEADTISGNQLEEIHLRICKNKPMVHRMSRLSAEIAKIALNCALVTKISFANMVGDLAETVGAEKDKILASIGSDSRIGPKFLGYGFGSGGPCCRDFQLVQTSKGLKPISEIVIGEAVLTHKGRYRKVTQTFKTPYTGKMFELLSTGNNNITSSFTPNHPIYCSKNNKTFNFYEVGLFNGSEELALPKYNNDKISEPFNIFYKGKSKSKHMDVKITPEIMKMFGFFLSEGCVLNSNKIRKEDRIVFTFHKKELDYANFIKEIFAKYFNRSVLIKEKKGNNSIVAVSKSVPLAKWFLKNFGKYSHDKKVPYEWLDLPNEYLQELLKGIWYGDGSKTENIYTLGLTSLELINFVRLCLLKFGIAHTISYFDEKIDKNGIKHKKSYCLKITNPLDIEKMSNILPDMQIKKPKFRNRKHIWFDAEKDLLRFKIKNFKTYDYSGFVYNIEVEEDNSYVLENCTVHNCLPRDARALAYFAKENKSYANIPLAADEANKQHLKKQVEFFIRDNPDKNKKYYLHSLSYKPESTLTEESQQLKFAVELAKKNYKIIVNEREEVIKDIEQEYKDLFEYQTRFKHNNKKVISFTLFGNKQIYLNGAIENAKLAFKHFPNWECRFYVASDIPKNIVRQLGEYGATVVIKNNLNGYNGLFWRFEPLLESNVDVWISRDVDSRLSTKDFLAVEEWLSSNKTFHLMRDSHNHDLYAIMAGMFGINNVLFRQKYENIVLDCPTHQAHQRDIDQLVLQEKLWHIVKNDHVCHDYWAHNQPLNTKLINTERDDMQAYNGQGVVGHVTNRKQNYPDHFLEGSINKDFPQHEPLEYGHYLGQVIDENNIPVMNQDVIWELSLRNKMQ